MKMKLVALIGMLFLLIGCATSEPYLELRVAYQIDPWSDWVLQPERDWTPDSESRMNLQAGLEWDNNVSCYVDSMIAGPWDQMFIGCSRSFGKKWFIETALVHQVDSRTQEFLRTDQKQWQGHNPFFHVRVGYNINPAFRCNIATGKSLFQGAPFEREEGAPDIYWVNAECSGRFKGKHGLFSSEHMNSGK